MLTDYRQEVAANAEELVSWAEYRSAKLELSGEIPIPYGFTVGAVTFGGNIYLRVPAEETSVEGFFVGIVVGNYSLYQNNPAISLYDPTGVLIRADVRVDIDGRKLEGRVCTRQFLGDWICTDWATLAAW
ncbi:MAG: hypothetical protein JOZ78_10455 [Chroococcidiopsidaceae cyanobacterium CP_BM_ER_R8_30]|nr:hypothetical protein [Chroococcidiopsidaceae cyanobacterium CP_BM_ER_R8_30]